MRSNLSKVFTRDAMQGIELQCHSFWCSLKIHQNGAKKPWFSGSFLEIFRLRSPTPSESIFCQIKGIIKTYNLGKFHEYSFCGCQVIDFQSFSYRFSIHEMALLGGFLGPNFPKYCPILMQVSPEVVFKEKKGMF